MMADWNLSVFAIFLSAVVTLTEMEADEKGKK